MTHQGSDGRRSGVEYGHLVPFHDLPPTVRLGIVQRPLIQYAGDALQERPEDQVPLMLDNLRAMGPGLKKPAKPGVNETAKRDAGPYE